MNRVSIFLLSYLQNIYCMFLFYFEHRFCFIFYAKTLILPNLGRGVDSEVNEWFRHTHYKQTAARLRTSCETNCGSAEILCFIGFRDYYPCWDSAVCTVPARVVPGQCTLHYLRLWRGHGNPWTGRRRNLVLVKISRLTRLRR